MNLTDKQIENWRTVLVGMFGPYALVMPRAQIEAYAEKIQEYADTPIKNSSEDEK